MSCERILKKFAVISRTDLLFESIERDLHNITGEYPDNPIIVDSTLHEALKKGAEEQEAPFLFRDSQGVFFGAFRLEEGYVFIGPMAVGRMGVVELRRFYGSYGISTEDVRGLYAFSVQEILSVMEILGELLTGKSYEDSQIWNGRRMHLQEDTCAKKEKALYTLWEDEQNEDEETYRHSYAEERRLMEAISEGRTEDAILYNRELDGDKGRLSKRAADHWKNLAIVGITLATRAAIQGGLSPRTAYQISGYFIRKCDDFYDAVHFIRIRDDAIRELTEQVRKKKEAKAISGYTKRCRDYIEKHYREKIYLDDLSEILGISPTYMSRLFKKEMGVAFQDYVNQVRIERACNLLKYSDESLSVIAEYMHFPSQSYFGKIFKNQMHMTPKEYRNRYQPEEWIQDID